MEDMLENEMENEHTSYEIYELANRQLERGPGDADSGIVGDALNGGYRKTAGTVSAAYEKARRYGLDNPGTTALFTFGIGAGLGFLAGSRIKRSRTRRVAEPVVDAVSNRARRLFR